MAIAHEASSAVRLEPAASEAAERLFQQHAGWIYGYCLRQLRSPEEAEDALQATYLNACRSLKAGFEPRAASAWLLKVAQNVCITRLRSSGRRARLERSQPHEVLDETLAAPDRAADELIGLPEALATLPAAQRRAILLREWQGLSYREVAEELGVSPSAVETLIFRARRSLAAALERPETRGPRALYGWNVGGLGAALKSLLAGGAAAKVAAVVAVAATATVVAADPVGRHGRTGPEPVAERATPAASAGREPASGPELARERSEHRVVAFPPVASEPASRGRALAPEKRAKKVDRPARGKPNDHRRDRARPDRGKANEAHGRPAEPSSRPAFAGSGGPSPHASAPPKKAEKP
jgi:RNA polymerase sigma-70 factor (ECF subfamily)